jgi:hypothetical protein
MSAAGECVCAAALGALCAQRAGHGYEVQMRWVVKYFTPAPYSMGYTMERLYMHTLQAILDQAL